MAKIRIYVIFSIQLKITAIGVRVIAHTIGHPKHPSCHHTHSETPSKHLLIHFAFIRAIITLFPLFVTYKGKIVIPMEMHGCSYPINACPQKVQNTQLCPSTTQVF